MKNILDEIARLRMERGWTEYQLAKNSNVPQSTISTWYRKNQVPTIDNLNKICLGLGISLSDFFLEGDDAKILTPEQKELVKHWLTLSPAQRKIVLELLEHMGTK